MEQLKDQDSWFCSMTFPHILSINNAEKQVKEWLRRLRQTLGLTEDQVFSSYLFAPQLRGVWHVHMMVRAKGLSSLDQERWEEKWYEITAHKWSKDITVKHSSLVPRTIIRRGNEEFVSKWESKFEDVVVGKNTWFGSGGTCKIRQVGNEYISRHNNKYICDFEGINSYMKKRHSHEMFDPQFNRAFVGLGNS